MELIQAHESNYSKGRQRAIKYIVLHYTGNYNDTAKANCKYFTEPNRNASAHYFADRHGVLQSVKDTDVAWHCGGKHYVHPECRNSNSIGVEICTEWADGYFRIGKETEQNALELVRGLMKKYGIPAENVIRHYDVTGKKCPEPWVREPEKWEEFKRRLTEMTIEEAKEKVKEKYKFDDNTMLYLEMYRYGEQLIKRLAERVQ